MALKVPPGRPGVAERCLHSLHELWVGGVVHAQPHEVFGARGAVRWLAPHTAKRKGWGFGGVLPGTRDDHLILLGRRWSGNPSSKFSVLSFSFARFDSHLIFSFSRKVSRLILSKTFPFLSQRVFTFVTQKKEERLRAYSLRSNAERSDPDVAMEKRAILRDMQLVSWATCCGD